MNNPMQLYIGTDAGDIVPFDGLETVTPDGPYATGGFVPYEEYKPPVIDTTDYVIGWIQPKINISPKQFYVALLGMTKRQYRMATRRAERIRREWLKRGTKCPLRFAMACNEIMSGKKTPKEYTFNFQGYQDKLSIIRTESVTSGG
jgi:hypothetical protein